MAGRSRAGWELAAGPGFSPRDVPEVAAGYFWDAAAASGLGTTGFTVPEGNGHTSFDLLQATVANQPIQLTESGGLQFRMGKTGSANPARLGSSGLVLAGWTGPTYVGAWVRFPDNAGDIGTAGDSILRHSGNASNQRFTFAFTNGSPDRLQSQPSNDGTVQATHLAGCNSPTDGSWQWLEIAFDFQLSLGGASPADEVKFFKNLVQLTRSVSPSVAIGSLFNGSAQVFAFCGNATTSNADTTDWAACYYCNGIPSLANRKRLANFRNPSGVLL